MSEDKNIVFVGHDFDKKGGRKKKFRKAIEVAFRDTTYIPCYADTRCYEGDMTSIEGMFLNIRRKIKSAKFCIFDLTKAQKKRPSINLNVLLELGISLGEDRTSFMLYRGNLSNLEKRVSNLKGWYTFSYKAFSEFSTHVGEMIEAFKGTVMGQEGMEETNIFKNSELTKQEEHETKVDFFGVEWDISIIDTDLNTLAVSRDAYCKDCGRKLIAYGMWIEEGPHPESQIKTQHFSWYCQKCDRFASFPFRQEHNYIRKYILESVKAGFRKGKNYVDPEKEELHIEGESEETHVVKILKNNLLKLAKDVFPCFKNEWSYSFSNILQRASQHSEYGEKKRVFLHHMSQRMYILNDWFYYFIQKKAIPPEISDIIQQLSQVLQSAERLTKEVKNEIKELPDNLKEDYSKLKIKHDHWIERLETFLREASDLLHEDFTKISFDPLPEF